MIPAMPKVLFEKRGRIASITFNRPEAKNAVDPEMHDLLVQTWTEVRDDDGIDVAIVTGSGDAFAPAPTSRPTSRRSSAGSGGCARSSTSASAGSPVAFTGYEAAIAAVNGWALAGGLEQALACDIRIASERAMFGSFEARRGYHHGDGGIVRLVNACGTAVASHMLLTAEPIDARQALEWRLVTGIVPHDELMEAAEEDGAPDPAQLAAGRPQREGRSSTSSARTSTTSSARRPGTPTPAPTPRRPSSACGVSTSAPTRAARGAGRQALTTGRAVEQPWTAEAGAGRAYR